MSTYRLGHYIGNKVIYFGFIVQQYKFVLIFKIFSWVILKFSETLNLISLALSHRHPNNKTPGFKCM